MRDGIRPYQIEASEAIEASLQHRHRKMLVTMATGTGKTLMTVHEVYRLMRAGVARRVLVLVDRKALAAQAVRAFKSFEAEPGKKFDSLYEVYSQRFAREDFGEEDKFDPTVLPKAHLTDPKQGAAFVYVSTIQRMTINLFGRSAVFSDEERIEDDVDQLLTVAETLLERVQVTASRVERSSHAILAKAFRGDLGTRDESMKLKGGLP